jgi:tetratricopeptide (TPR) repeat protein
MDSKVTRFAVDVLVLFIAVACSTLTESSHQTLGKQHLQNSEYQDAIRELELATTEYYQPTGYVIDSWILLGSAYLKYHRPKDAVQAYKNALNAIAKRVSKIREERVKATISAFDTGYSRGPFEKLSNVIELQKEEMELRSKYNELTANIEDISN